MAALEEGGGKEQESQEHVPAEISKGGGCTRGAIPLHHLQLLTAEQAFTDCAVSGLQSTTAVVAKFVANEDENFSLFNFIQQTNDEVWQQEAVDKIRADMDRFRREKEAKSEHAYEVIHSLKSKRTHAEDRIHQVKSRLAEARLELLQLCTGVSQMFSHIGCSWDVGGDASGNAQSGEGAGGEGGGGDRGAGGPGGGSGIPPGTANSSATSMSGTGGPGSGIETPEGGAKPNNILIYTMIEHARLKSYRNLSACKFTSSSSARCPRPRVEWMTLMTSVSSLSTLCPPPHDESPRGEYAHAHGETADAGRGGCGLAVYQQV